MTETTLSKYPVDSQGVTLAYLLALLLPLSFFYSPRIEKSNIVMVTKPLTITQERNTPAYTLFQQTQIIQKKAQNYRQAELRKLANQSQIVELTTENVATLTAVTPLPEIKLEKAELVAKTDQQLQTLLNEKPDSTSYGNTYANARSPATAAPKFSPTTEGAVIRGQFELKDGVGIVDHTVILKRVFEGQAFELGQVDLKAGQYQIAVGSFEGEIVAEVKDKTGILIGEDRQKLFNLKREGQFFAGPTMKLGRPSAFAFNPRSVDQRSLKPQNLIASFFSGFYELKKTDDSYPNVARHSSTLGIIKDNTGAIATTLSVRSSADRSDTVLFSKKWVDGAVSYLSEQLQIQYLPETGIIIGRILVDGKPVQGAQVVVENQPGLEPYYLDQFLIPQNNQTNTSDNGYFIIPGLNSGVYEISGFIGERHLGTQQFIVETDLVTYQELYSSSLPQSVIARSFDAFTGEIVSTELFVPGQKDILNLETGLNKYRHNASYGLTEVVNRPMMRDYANYVYLQSQSKDHLHLPQIKDAFVDYVRAQSQITPEADTSTFIGFTPQNHFDVHIADDSFNTANLVYFDAMGNISPTQIVGGGFIVFNLKSGIQELILQDQQSDRSFSTVLYSRADYLFVSHFAE